MLVVKSDETMVALSAAKSAVLMVSKKVVKSVDQTDNLWVDMKVLPLEKLLDYL